MDNSKTSASGSQITSLALRSFRTYERLDVELRPGLTVFCGPNGIGKTNLIEALAMACSGASPRTSSEFRVIRSGSSFARIAAEVIIDGRQHERVVRIEAGAGKRLEIDRSVIRSVDEFASSLPAVSFLPERLLVVRGAPARRRALLDRCVARMMPRSAADFRKYVSAMAQRNNLLRRAKGGAEVRTQIQPWTEQMVEAGTA
ncbi:MAG: DNA replication/repair protein RecF, partial [Thermoleophilia bacterium]|nr:DNA replication/repair protein RecF [Thermoleophilia bacterium]